MYLDLGSWGVVVQFLLASLISVPIFVGVYWRHIKEFFNRRRDEKGK